MISEKESLVKIIKYIRYPNFNLEYHIYIRDEITPDKPYPNWIYYESYFNYKKASDRAKQLAIELNQKQKVARINEIYSTQPEYF